MTSGSAPTIICPPWCVTGAAAHVADLDNQEGRCIHSGADNGDGWSLSTVTHPDGRLWPEEGEDAVEVWDGGNMLSLDEAEHLARSILALVADGRASVELLSDGQINVIRQNAIDRGL